MWLHAIIVFRLFVTEEVSSLTAVSYPKRRHAAFLQDATSKSWTAWNILVLHRFSTHPEPLVTKETQACHSGESSIEAQRMSFFNNTKTEQITSLPPQLERVFLSLVRFHDHLQ